VIKKIFNTIRLRLKKHIMILSILHMGERIGIQVTPYYLTSESPPNEEGMKFKPKIQPVECSFVSPSEIDKLYSFPELKDLYIDLDIRHINGSQCFVLKNRDNILAYMWCNLHRFNSAILALSLKKNEAYVFGARALSDYRGMNLVPYLRSQLYQRLAQDGYTNFYGITECFNAPAIKVGQKLNARRLKLGLFVCIFYKIKWNINLKNYSTRDE
jgi:hypothetical protein